MTVRILHLADLHLGWEPAFLGPKAKQRALERDSLLQRAVDYSLEKNNNIDAVVIAGDLFDTHLPSAQTREYALAQLNRLDRAGVFLLTVPGNHDEYTYDDSVYRSEASRWPGVLVTQPHPGHVATLEKEGEKTAFYSLAYTAGLTRTLPAISDLPRVDADRHVGVLHGTLAKEAKDRSLPINPAAIAAAKYDYMALGHLHAHSVRQIGRTLACYAGATEAKHFSDPGTGFFTVASLFGQAAVEKVSAGCRPCLTKTVDLGLYDDIKSIYDTVSAAADKEAMVRVVLHGQTSFQLNTEEIYAHSAPRFFHLQIESENTYVDNAALSKIAEEPTFRGSFVKSLLSKIEETDDNKEKEILQRALKLGIEALQKGVQNETPLA